MERKPLEVGKLYKRRDGKKCVCIWIDSDGIPVTATLKGGDLNGELVFAGKPCGEIFGFGVADDHRDIIGEWVEPRKPLEFWINIYPDQANVLRSAFLTKEDAIGGRTRGMTSHPTLFREVLE